MTPLTPSDCGFPSHPDIEQLADLAEDLLAPAAAEALRRHLAECPDCADSYAALAEVGLLLGSTEAPAMPADVAARIDAALAAEAASASLLSPSPGPSPSVDPGPARPGYAPPNRATDSTGPGRPRRRRRARILLGTAALAVGLTLGTLLLHQPGTSGSDMSASTGSNHVAAPQSPGRNPAAAAQPAPEYREDQLPEQIHQLLATAPSQHPMAQAQSATTGPDGTSDTSLPACVTAAAGHSGEPPLASGPGRYGQSEITALVYRVAGRTDRLDVYLVTPACPGATVLLHRTIPA